MTRQTELYRHFDADGTLLYVGIAENTQKRFFYHRGTPWFNLVATTTIERFETRRDAAAAECAAIKSERPRFNRTHSVNKTGAMTDKQYRDALARLGMTQGEAAKFLGVTIRASNGYANGRLISESIAMLLRLMIRLNLKPEDVE